MNRRTRSSWLPAVGLYGPRTPYAGGRLDAYLMMRRAGLQPPPYIEPSTAGSTPIRESSAHSAVPALHPSTRQAANATGETPPKGKDGDAGAVPHDSLIPSVPASIRGGDLQRRLREARDGVAV